MPRNETIDRVIEGVTDNGTVWVDLLRNGNGQLYRFNRLVIDELERTQEERANLFQQWATSPTDLTGFANSLLLTWTRRSRRRMELTRTIIDDLRDMGAGTRSLWERMTDANRQTARAAVRAGQETIGEVARDASNVADDLGEATDKVARDLKRDSRRVDPRPN